MNSSPLNPDAPVFVPGSVGGDTLLAESPRKPKPMDDIELPDIAQFETEAAVRPAELLDLDNCDQLNGHHVSFKLRFWLHAILKLDRHHLLIISDFIRNFVSEPEVCLGHDSWCYLLKWLSCQFAFCIVDYILPNFQLT